MKELLSVVVADDMDMSVTTDYCFSSVVKKALRFDRNDPLYQRLVDAIKQCNPDCLHAIRMLESARKDARYEYKELHPKLEKALKDWRRTKSAELEVPAYIVLHQKVLLSIADAAPTTEEQLLAIPGFGPGLFAKYGEEVLALINAQ